MSRKNRLYLLLDLAIALAFVLSLLTAWAWMSSKPGRNGSAFLGIARGGWRDLHIGSSLALIAGVVVHLALHWEWIAAMTRRLGQSRMKKALWNYALDAVLGLTLVAVLVTGLPFLVAGPGGYQGGRNPAYRAAFVGVKRSVMSDWHVGLGLGFVAVLLVHLAMHWNWIRRSVRQLVCLTAPEVCPGR
jgi:hypothetical protein